MSDPLNILTAAVAGDPDDPQGYRSRGLSFGELIGAQALGASIYELDPGDSVCPYHYENAEEEWLLVLAGAPTLRDPDGEHQLAPGDLVCFTRGPDGAHKVTNNADALVRILMFSTKPDPDLSICVYPDSDKVGVWPPGGRFRMSESLSYWDGEV
jgi:uncharacterized cupin superfamily protein